MNITGRPIYQKPAKAEKKRRKPMRRVSKKREAQARTPEGKADAAYLDAVRSLPCIACGKPGPSDPHHCKDIPPFDEQGLYQRLPGAGMTSGDRDAIPLCKFGGCHWLYHNKPSEFRARYGPDYGFIPVIRAEISTAELDF